MFTRRPGIGQPGIWRASGPFFYQAPWRRAAWYLEGLWPLCLPGALASGSLVSGGSLAPLFTRRPGVGQLLGHGCSLVFFFRGIVLNSGHCFTFGALFQIRGIVSNSGYTKKKQLDRGGRRPGQPAVRVDELSGLTSCCLLYTSPSPRD